MKRVKKIGLLLVGIAFLIISGYTGRTQRINEFDVTNVKVKEENDENIANTQEKDVGLVSETDIFNKIKESPSSETVIASTNIPTKDLASTPPSTNKNAPSVNKTEEHTHTWIAQTKTVNYAEEGHYETKIIQEAYDEEVYVSRTFCNRCKDSATGNPLDITGAPWDHVISVCGGGYYADRVVVDTIHHDAVTEQIWIVDKAAWTETVITGYQCSCGATK